MKPPSVSLTGPTGLSSRSSRLDACAGGEVAAHDRVHQDGYSALRARVVDILAQYLVKGVAGDGIAVFVLDLLVVVAELYYHIVAGADILHHLVPAALADKALGRAAVHGVVVDLDGALEVEGEHLAPAALLILLVKRLVGHGRVADHEDGDRIGFLDGRRHGHQRKPECKNK